MARSTTALTVYEIPGRPRGAVRVHRPADGKSSFRVIWTDDHGKQRERTYPCRETADDAAAAIAESLAITVRTGVAEVSTFRQVVHHHLYGRGMSPSWNSPRSIRRPREIARRYLTEEDLDLPVSALSGQEGIAFFNRIMARVQALGTKPGTQEYEKAGALLWTTLNVAHRDGLIQLPFGNPMRTINYRMSFYSTRSDRRAATVDYIDEDLRPSTPRVLEFVECIGDMFGEREALYVRTMAFGGLRPGEANALSPRQVLDGDHDGLNIDQQVLELTAEEAAVHNLPTQHIRLPKWGLVRDAWIPPELRTDLLRWAEDNALGPEDVYFPSPRGHMRWQGNWRGKVFNKVAAEVGWPHELVHTRGRLEKHWLWSVYAFRHHYANYLLKECEVPIYLVSDYMGHRHTWITEHMYAQPQRADLDYATAAHLRRTQRATP